MPREKVVKVWDEREVAYSLKKWRILKEKRIPPEMFAEIVNFITNEITPLIMVVSKEMRIPYPIPLPRVSIKQP